MKIDELVRWLDTIESGDRDCAVRDSVRVCLSEAEEAATLRVCIEHLQADAYTAYVLSLGHLIAVNAMNVTITNVAARKAAGDGGSKKPFRN